jgi:hypothetical protein
MRLEGRTGAWIVDGEPLAIGGQAAIYPAHAEDGGHPVVVKVALVPGCPSIRAEGERLRALAGDPAVGPLVVPLWDEGEWDERPFLVLERRPFTLASWVPGRSRASRLTLARRLADAVHVLQARGVVHGDVKPSNVLLDDGDPPAILLADFGSAAGGTAGTAGFAAPERALEANPDLASDRFSLGATIAWLLPDVEDAAVHRALHALRDENARRRPDISVLVDAFTRPQTSRRWAWSSGWALLAALGPDLEIPPCPSGFSPDGAACEGPDGRRVPILVHGARGRGSARGGSSAGCGLRQVGRRGSAPARRRGRTTTPGTAHCGATEATAEPGGQPPVTRRASPGRPEATVGTAIDSETWQIGGSRWADPVSLVRPGFGARSPRPGRISGEAGPNRTGGSGEVPRSSRGTLQVAFLGASRRRPVGVRLVCPVGAGFAENSSCSRRLRAKAPANETGASRRGVASRCHRPAAISDPWSSKLRRHRLLFAPAGKRCLESGRTRSVDRTPPPARRRHRR